MRLKWIGTKVERETINHSGFQVTIKNQQALPCTLKTFV